MRIKLTVMATCLVLGAMVDGSVVVPVSDLAMTETGIGTETETETTYRAPIEDDRDLITRSTICHEDMQCWDCESMGNRICGSGDTFPDLAACIAVHGVGDSALAYCADMFDLPCNNPYVDPYRADCTP